MASAKSGNAGSPVPPMDPKNPEEADKADPGEMTQIKARQREQHKGKYGSTPFKSHKPPETEEEKKKKKSWIEIVLVDEDNDPVPGEAYRIILPDGYTQAEGSLDEKGFARVDGIEPGTCNITFPNLDKSGWKPA